MKRRYDIIHDVEEALDGCFEDEDPGDSVRRLREEVERLTGERDRAIAMRDAITRKGGVRDVIQRIPPHPERAHALALLDAALAAPKERRYTVTCESCGVEMRSRSRAKGQVCGACTGLSGDAPEPGEEAV